MQLEGVSDELDILSKKMELNGSSSQGISEYSSLLKQHGSLHRVFIISY